MTVLTTYPWVADAFAAVREESGGRFVTAACPLTHDHPANKLRLWVSNGKSAGSLSFKCWAGCPKLEILRAVGRGWRDCYPGGSVPEDVRQQVAARYRYTDESGVLLYETVRLEPGRNGRDKEFRQRRPDPADARRWLWSLGDVRRVVYRLPEVVRSPRVHVVAGEKDADSLWKIGMAATTNVCGERAEWLPAYTASLAGKEVVVVEDADEAGRRHADEVCGSLLTAARSVRRVRLASKDATAFLNGLRAGGIVDPEELRRLWRAAVETSPRWVSETT